MSRVDERVAVLDITRAVALMGVVVMNFHGFLDGDPTGGSMIVRIFDISSGVLSTRFAAVFVLVAGVALALMTAGHSDTGRSRARLARRGATLLIGGALLERAWPGTIIFYYGAYFILAGLFVTAPTGVVIAIGIGSALGSTGLGAWEVARRDDGHSTAWLHPISPDDPREWLIRIFVDGTHPVLPWLVFLCAGIVIGRRFDTFRQRSGDIALGALVVVIVTYVGATVLDASGLRDGSVARRVTSMQPFDGGPLYVISTLGIAVLTLALITRLGETPRFVDATAPLRLTGQVTLSLYLLHVVVFYAVARWTRLVSPGLANSVMLGIVFWLAAVPLASWWCRRWGRGPAERVYRMLGG